MSLAVLQRTCCICRSKASKGELARLVISGTSINLDPLQRMPGRGAYVHKKVDCLVKMNQPGRWKRALRVEHSEVDFSRLSFIAKDLLEDLKEC